MSDMKSSTKMRLRHHQKNKDVNTSKKEKRKKKRFCAYLRMLFYFASKPFKLIFQNKKTLPKEFKKKFKKIRKSLKVKNLLRMRYEQNFQQAPNNILCRCARHSHMRYTWLLTIIHSKNDQIMRVLL